MSEQEQQQISQSEQVEQGSEAVAAEVPQEVATSEKVVESAGEPAVQTSEPVVSEEPAASDAGDKEKSVDDKVEPTAEKEAEAQEKKALPEDAEVEKTEQPAEKPASESAEVTNGDADVAKTNGQAVDEEQPAVTEGTNGVHKRKAENGSEPVAAEDEKSPKKAKVIEDGDQAKVEETAA